MEVVNTKSQQKQIKRKRNTRSIQVQDQGKSKRKVIIDKTETEEINEYNYFSQIVSFGRQSEERT